LAPTFERPHPYLLRDSNFLLPRSGSNSFDAEGVRVSFYMSRFGQPRNPRWDHWMDSAAMGSSSMKLDNKRAPYAAGPLRQASRLCIRVTPVRCLADIPEPRYLGSLDSH
jgi:hypothetical protein